MPDSDQRIIDALLVAEGWPAYTDHPADDGGPTKGGITLRTLRDWRRNRGAQSTISTGDLRELTLDEAREIYRAQYIDHPNFHWIADVLLRHQVIDAGVLVGPGRATGWLQEVVRELGEDLRVDRIFGPLTKEAVNRVDPHRAALLFVPKFATYLADRVQQEPDNIVWVEGWIARATSPLYREAER